MVIDRHMIDVAGGGALVDKTSTAARQLIKIMASNDQQFNTCSNSTTNYAVDHAHMKAQLDNLTSMMKQLTMP